MGLFHEKIVVDNLAPLSFNRYCSIENDPNASQFIVFQAPNLRKISASISINKMSPTFKNVWILLKNTEVKINFLTCISFIKRIVSRDFEWLQIILMSRSCVPDVSLKVYSFLNLHLHIVFKVQNFERDKLLFIQHSGSPGTFTLLGAENSD